MQSMFIGVENWVTTLFIIAYLATRKLSFACELMLHYVRANLNVVLYRIKLQISLGVGTFILKYIFGKYILSGIRTYIVACHKNPESQPL